MSEVKKIPKEDLLEFVNLSNNAYPSFSVDKEEDKNKMIEYYGRTQEESKTRAFYGLYRENKLLGGMLCHEYKMNYDHVMVKATGVGMVAVDALHKKEKVAKEMIEFFIRNSREKDFNLAILYPFRLDFYKKMGFGYGTKMDQYRLKPSTFVKSDLRKNLVNLSNNDKDLIRDCYNEFVYKTHGMIEMDDQEYNNLLKNPKMRGIGYQANGKLLGYILYTYKTDPDNFLIQDLMIHKMIYQTKEAFLGIQGYFNSQADQIRYIVIQTQDESFHHLFLDPTNGTLNIIPHVYHESNIQGVGFMYRITNVDGFFKEIESYNFIHETCKVKLTIQDNFIIENSKDYILSFDDGKLTLDHEGTFDVEIKMDIAEFSSLMMGVIEFKKLYLYSLLECSNEEYLEQLNRLFKKNEKPICMTGF